jgi:hypothetical protein
MVCEWASSASYLPHRAQILSKVWKLIYMSLYILYNMEKPTVFSNYSSENLSTQFLNLVHTSIACSKESPTNTDQKVCLHQFNILKFLWSNLNKVYFEVIFENLRKKSENSEIFWRFDWQCIFKQPRSWSDWIKYSNSRNCMFNSKKMFENKSLSRDRFSFKSIFFLTKWLTHNTMVKVLFIKYCFQNNNFSYQANIIYFKVSSRKRISGPRCKNIRFFV